MRTLNWKTLSPARKTALIIAGTLQVGLFAAAWADLSRRRPEAVNGRKVDADDTGEVIIEYDMNKVASTELKYEIYRSADHERLVEVPRTHLSTDASLWPRAYFPSTDARLSVEEMLARAEQLEEEARSYTQRIRRLLRRVPAHPSD